MNKEISVSSYCAIKNVDPLKELNHKLYDKYFLKSLNVL